MQKVEREGATKHEPDESSNFRKFMMLFVTGFLMVLIGTMILIVTMLFYGYNDSASFSMVIFVGPFPIMIGAGSNLTLMVLLATVIAVLTIIMLTVSNRKMKKTSA